MAPASSGCPCIPSASPTPANLSTLGSAKRVANSACSSPRMLTANAPAAATACPVSEVRLMQTSSIGGSSDSELTALAVVPWRRPPASA